MKKEGPKSKLNILVIILLTMLVLFFSLKDDFNSVVNEIISINPLWLLVGLILLLFYLICKTLVLLGLVKKVNPQYSFKKAFRLELSTQFFNAVTPFSSGGQPFQVYMLKRDGVNIPNGTNIVIQNFILYQIALIILGSIAVVSNYFFHFYKEVEILRDLVTIGFAINLFVIIGLFIISFAEKFNKRVSGLIISLLAKVKIVKNKEKNQSEWEHYINNFHEGAKMLISDSKLFFKGVFLNLLSLSCLYLIPMVVIFGMGNKDLNPFITIITSAYVMLIGSFVPIPGGTGGLEYSYIAFFGNFITGSMLKASMLIWRFITYYLGMIIGAITFNMKGKD